MTEMRDGTRARLYAAYASTHAGLASRKANDLAFLRDIRPHLPPNPGLRAIDLGCGQGELVAAFHRHGFLSAEGIDISAEQVELARQRGVKNVRLGDFEEGLRSGGFDVVTATDLLEHLDRDEVLAALDLVFSALRPAGILIARVPNLVSPFGGNYRYGDITHETSFTARSIRQLGRAAGFENIRVLSCPPPIHGAVSFVRRAIWNVLSAGMKLALAAETGQLRGHHVTQNVVAVMQKSPGH